VTGPATGPATGGDTSYPPPAAVTAPVQWALYDSTPGREDDPVLGYSSGGLSRANFLDAISRTELGATPDPTQVVVSCLKRGKGPDDRYLALAFHGSSGTTSQSGLRARRTRFFCVGYDRLAQAGIGYQAMCAALWDIPLPGTPEGLPLTVSFTAPALLSPRVEPLAVKAAALLLTGRPVCLLGARSVSVPDRLAFIDAVMSLLPYGLRSTMTATTWIDPTKDQAPSFKLFFSSDRRPRHPEDLVLTWGQPDHGSIPARPAHARAYHDWLTEAVGRTTSRMAELTEPIGFGRPDLVIQALTQAGLPSDGFGFSQPASSPTEAILLECVAGLANGDHDGLRDNLVALRVYAEHTKARPEDLARYQQIVTDHKLLLVPDAASDAVRDEVCYALVRLAFGVPFTYDAYCQLEDSLTAPGQADPSEGAVPQLHAGLRRAIDRALRTDHAGGVGDDRAAAVAAAALSEAERDLWSAAGLLDVPRLVGLLAGSWDRPQHAALVLDVTVNRLAAVMRDRDSDAAKRAHAALHDRGYLASALRLRHPQARPAQIAALEQLIGTVYPDLLDWPTIEAILRQTELTRALRIVLMKKTDDHESLDKLEDWPTSPG
jgi:hypothetical protein